MAQSSSERNLVVFMRVVAVVMSLAIVAVVMPWPWIDFCHRRLDLGAFPEQPIAEYLARQLSAFYAFFGVVFWFVSRDVRRFLPLIRFQACLWLLLSFVFVAIDWKAGLPAYWIASEGGSNLALSAILLTLQSKAAAAVAAEAGDASGART